MNVFLVGTPLSLMERHSPSPWDKLRVFLLALMLASLTL